MHYSLELTAMFISLVLADHTVDERSIAYPANLPVGYTVASVHHLFRARADLL